MDTMNWETAKNIALAPELYEPAYVIAAIAQLEKEAGFLATARHHRGMRQIRAAIQKCQTALQTA